MTEPVDPRRDGSERGRPAQTGLDTEAESQGAELREAESRGPELHGAELHGADVEAVARDASANMAGSGDASDDDVEEAGADPVADDPADDPAVDPADDPGVANGQVAAALAELDAAADWPPADQVAAFTAAHEALQATLARIDDH